MRIVRSTALSLTGLAVCALAAGPASAQTRMPSTLRYGSGYLDVPVASVLPHMAITGTYSGFWLDLDRVVRVDQFGRVIAPGGERRDFMSDGSVALGLFDRLELGATLQSFNDAAQGGNMWGGFAKLAILRPQDQGIGLAAGVQYVTAPDYDDGIDRMPPRLGFPDSRFRAQYGTVPVYDVDTEITPYGVATALFRGFESDLLPRHDFSFTMGYGGGMFNRGDKLPWYAFVDSEGWFGGAAVHLGVSERSILHIMGEWNGFDTNLGAQLDFGGIRVGGHYLGSNYFEDVTEYRSPKWGLLGSLALCPGGDGWFCRPQLLDRPVPDTVRLPAPPADTVAVTRDVTRTPPLPTGTAASICLATGEVIQVLVTAQNDTLVGPQRVSIRELRTAGVVFAGEYAAGRPWFENDEALTFEQRDYQKSGDPVRLNCPDIMRVGEWMGVPLFARRDATRPYQTLYVPITPGVWQAYESLRATRGDGG